LALLETDLSQKGFTFGPIWSITQGMAEALPSIRELVFPPENPTLAHNLGPREIPPDAETPKEVATPETGRLPGQVEKVVRADDSPTFFIVYKIAPGYSDISVSYERTPSGQFFSSAA
jgi:hypothetical protein